MMKRQLLATAICTALLGWGGTAQANPLQSVSALWSYDHGAATPGRSAEIPVWDAATASLWVVGGNGLDVLNLSGSLVQSFNTSAFGSVNSIAISGGLLAVSFTNGLATSAPGSVQFFDTASFLSQGGSAAYLGGVNTGAVPDMLNWASPTRLLVANEGERQSDSDNPVGSISIIDLTPSGSGAFSTTVTTAGFGAFDGQEAALRAAGVRIQAGVSASVAFEPEYIAVAPNGLTAFVTLQENNALAELDLDDDGALELADEEGEDLDGGLGAVEGEGAAGDAGGAAADDARAGDAAELEAAVGGAVAVEEALGLAGGVEGGEADVEGVDAAGADHELAEVDAGGGEVGGVGGA
jgi:hypothetical protein